MGVAGVGGVIHNPNGKIGIMYVWGLGYETNSQGKDLSFWKEPKIS